MTEAGITVKTAIFGLNNNNGPTHIKIGNHNYLKLICIKQKETSYAGQCNRLMTDCNRK